MKRFSIAVFCLVMFFTSDVFAQDPPETLVFPTGTMTLTAPEGAERDPKLSPVLFPHSLHFSYSCKDCHHEWDGVNPVQSCSTAGCHENLWAAMPGTLPLDARRVKSLTGAYHKVCRDCHRKEAIDQKAAGSDNIATGPIACDGCHPTPHSEIENSDETMTIPLGNILLEAPEEVYAKRGSVDFPHGLHFQFACQDCHHDWDGESEIETCISCHDETEPTGSRNIKDEENVMYYLAAYHNVCVECHRETDKALKEQVKAMEQGKIKKADLPKAGPVGCNGCHS